MGIFFIYLIKSSVCLAAFYFLYKWLLSKETFASFNRKVLLFGIAVCLILPFIHWRITYKTPVQKPLSKIENMIAVTERSYEVLPEFPNVKPTEISITEQNTKSQETIKSHPESGLSLFQIISIVYGIGCGITFVSLLVSFIRLILLLRNGRKVKYGKYTLFILDKNIHPFSIGQFIAMSENDYHSNFNTILAHEQIHAEKHHSLDLIFAEAVIIIQWFNPAAWLLKRELHNSHEYEADRGAIQSSIDATQYQLLVIREAVGAKSYAIANSFNYCNIKNRIKMMTKQNSKQQARWKTLLFVPLIAFLVLAFSQSGTGQNVNRPNNSIVGVWKLVERNGKPVEGYQRIKMITETQFSWTTYSSDGMALQSAGGTYTLEGNVYTEFLKTTSDNMKSYLASKGVFTVEIKDNKLYQKGTLGNNVNSSKQSFDEVWKRVDNNSIIPTDN